MAFATACRSSVPKVGSLIDPPHRPAPISGLMGLLRHKKKRGDMVQALRNVGGGLVTALLLLATTFSMGR